MKITLVIIGISIIVIAVGLKLTSRYWIALFQNNEPKNPKYEIPITFNIGWWSYQKALHIDTFRVELIDSRLNLLNSYSLISYHIKGRLILDNINWEPYIDKIHVCERIIETDSISSDSTNSITFTLNKDKVQIGEMKTMPQAIIELTPIVKVKENKSYKAGQVIDFDIQNEHKIQSLHWGNNYLLIKCGQFEYPLVLQQRK